MVNGLNYHSWKLVTVQVCSNAPLRLPGKLALRLFQMNVSWVVKVDGSGEVLLILSYFLVSGLSCPQSPPVILFISKSHLFLEEGAPL